MKLCKDIENNKYSYKFMYAIKKTVAPVHAKDSTCI